MFPSRGACLRTNRGGRGSALRSLLGVRTSQRFVDVTSYPRKGAQHLGGLARTFDRIGVRGALNEAVGPTQSQVGLFGLLAILVIVALKFRAIEVIGGAENRGLLLAPVLGRLAMVVLAYSSRSLREDGVERVLGQVRGPNLFLATP